MSVSSSVKRSRRNFWRKIGYDPFTPMCANCNYFIGERLDMKGSIYKHKGSHCSKHHFITKQTGLCDGWISKEGDVLEAKLDQDKCKGE